MKPFFKFPPRPTLPAPLALPFQLIPGAVHSTVLTTALNVLFAGRIQQSGEFDFLRDQVLAIRVRDAKVEYRFRYAGPAGFVPGQSDQPPDLTISGAIYDFLALATRREDSDTLFFNRRVVMEGDTALGLELKNVLDAMDPEALGQPLPSLLQAANQCLAAYERLSHSDSPTP
ncbi:MAG TPA: SCP2 sterol-binding domain-containing protein [Candidatus Competibacteraceae bacterium]|nr:SCP2 sterol-binding domain-containing protein [Candidatus Competibacteraceae bacterium]HRZ06551.1 SCP2 sterol-binding domain-containing protein [Candidatus Competibacteraceae bacterium]HSA46871.1 SCP2 sterol-binding domain-containing protein [Candidatus Competibacteraceae bacterium]